MDDRTKSIWFYNGIHHWNGFERFSEPHLEPIQGFCRGMFFSPSIFSEKLSFRFGGTMLMECV